MARKAMREALESEAARQWAELMASEMGDPPPLSDAEAWWMRGEQAHALALQYGYGGPIGRLGDSYAEHCRQTAAVADARFRKTGQVTVEVTVGTLSQRLAEGRARAIDGAAKRLPSPK